MALSGQFEGRSFPSDVATAGAHPYEPLTTPAALVSSTDRPVLVRALGDRRTLLDFGQSSFGALQVKLHRPRTGRKLTVTTGERLSLDGEVWRFNPRDGPVDSDVASYAESFDTADTAEYLMVSGPGRAFPQASLLPGGLRGVLPFRYAVIDGAARDEFDAVRLTVSYPYLETEASFESSDSTLNAVWQLARYTITATSFAGIVVDGNRERKPYEGDAYIAQLGILALSSDRRLSRHTLEYLLANPTWPTEFVSYPVLMAYEDYRYSGDSAYLRSIYPQLRRRALLTLERPDGLIGNRTDDHSAEVANGLGMRGPMIDLIDYPENERDDYSVQRIALLPFLRATLRSWRDMTLATAAHLLGLPRAHLYFVLSARGAAASRYRPTETNAVVNAVHAIALARLGYFADVLGMHADARLFTKRATRVRDALHARMFDRHAGLYRDGEGSTHSSIHANMFPLAFGLVPSGDIGSVAAFLEQRGMRASPYGAQFLLDALYEGERDSAALALMTSRGERSWSSMLERTGSTMTTEAWSSAVKPDQDWSHVWSTAPVNIISRRLMGIRPTEPGFRRFAVRPQPGGLRSARLRMPTVRGPIEVGWECRGRMVLSVSVPGNAIADVIVPRGWLTPSGAVLRDERMEVATPQSEGWMISPLAPGHHRITGSAMMSNCA